MVIQRNCKFIENTSTPTVSKTFFNATGDTLTVQIDGAEGIYAIEGRNSANGAWYPLAAINLSNFAAMRDGLNAPGVYEIGIVGIRELRAKVDSVQGQVSIFGQIISTEET